jgi:large subunit ribosomal protein L15
MHLNTLSPAEGAKKTGKRLGRGIGCGRGKTCGKGHKGQRARAGGYHKLGFEGGQMPLQRRLPKFGFNSKNASSVLTLRLSELNNINAEMINLQVLRNAGIISPKIKSVRIMLSGAVTKPVSLAAEIKLTKGAKAAILEAGGKVE